MSERPEDLIRERKQAQQSVRQRILRRAVIYLFLLGILFGTYRLFQSFIKDPDLGHIDTADWIAAVEYKTDGAQAVLIKPDGTKVESPDHKPASTDRDVVWKPDGQRVFFSTDREGGIFQIARWNPVSNKIENRSVNKMSKSHASFGPPGYTGTDTALLVSGGFVVEFDPREGSAHQILPPVRAATQGAEGGSVGQFDALYQSLGTSFREAKFGKDRASVIAVLRSDVGEVLIRQSLVATQKGFAPPEVLAAGDHLEFDVNREGEVVMSVQHFRFTRESDVPPQFIVNGEVKLPFKHLLAFVPSDSNAMSFIARSNEDEKCSGKVRYSPDGKYLLVQLGALKANSGLDVQALVKCDAQENGLAGARPVALGAVTDFDWHPSGEKVILTKRTGSTIGLYSWSLGDENAKPMNIAGNFGEPRFSPALHESK